MGYKRFGKLAGNTNAVAALSTTAASNTLTPFVAQPEGAKFLAWGEGASSLAFNRSLGALQENIEQAYGLFDSPALAETRITAGDAVSVAQTHGTRALHAVTDGATSIDLNTLSNTGNTDLAPIYWVYTGLHKAQLGKFIRMYRYTNDATYVPLGSFDELNPSESTGIDARSTNIFIPLDITPNSAGSSIFDDPVTGLPQTYSTNAALSVGAYARFIPPIAPLATDLQPYAGSAIADAVTQWWNDGVSLSGYTWRELYMRPGCFAYVANAGANNGLYRIAEVRNLAAPSSDKAILTRGGLHKVKVDSAAAFTAGRLLAWATEPLFAAADPPTTAMLNAFAYVVFIDAAENTIYLADLSGEDDFGTYAAATPWGQKVDNTGTFAATADNSGTVGQIDAEVGTNSSNKLVVGQFIFDAADFTKKATVVAITQSNALIQFDTAEAGTVTPCSPLGFTLNPIIHFASTPLETGNYVIHCKRLATVRENMLAAGSTGQYKIIPNAADTLNYSEFEAGLVRAFTRYVKTGEEDASTRGAGSELPSGAFTASSMILGDGLWKVTFTPGAGDPDLTDVVTLNAPVFIVTPAGQYTRCLIQSVTGNTAVLSDVNTIAWALSGRFPSVDQDPIQAGSVLTIAGDTYTVSSVHHKPSVRYVPPVGAPTVFVPGFGLDAAYNNQYAASKYARAAGAGYFIRLAPGLPVTVILNNSVVDEGNDGFKVRSDNDKKQKLISFEGSTIACSVGISASGALLLNDSNVTIADGVPLSSALHTDLDPPYGGALTSNILGAITEQAGPFLADRGLFGGDGRAGAEIVRAPALTVGGVAVVFGTPIAGPDLRVAADGVGYYNGYYYEMPEQIEAIPAGFSQLVWDGAETFNSQYKFIAGEATSAQATIAFAYRAAPNTTFYNTALITQFANKKDSVITVGGTDSMFTTLADAVDAVYGLTNLSATRTHIIEVRGGTTETRTVTFRSGNISIRGVPGRQVSAANEKLASITWSGNRPCIDFNGNSHIVIRDLYLRYEDTGALGPSSTQSRVAFVNNSAATCQSITIDNVNIRSADTGVLHGYMYAVGSGGNPGVSFLSIRNCMWYDATDFGIFICGSAIIENNILSGTGALTQAGNVTPQGLVGGLLCSNAYGGSTSDHVIIAKNRVTGWIRYGIQILSGYTNCIRDNDVDSIISADAQVHVPAGNAPAAQALGIYLVSSTKTTVAANTVSSVTSSSSGVSLAQNCYGIYLTGGSIEGLVDSNRVTGVGSTLDADAYGIYVASDTSKVINSIVDSLTGDTVLALRCSGNKMLVTGNSYTGGAFSTAETAITIAGNNCIVDANQTGGMTGAGQTAIQVTGINNSIGAMNRDDP